MTNTQLLFLIGSIFIALSLTNSEDDGAGMAIIIGGILLGIATYTVL